MRRPRGRRSACDFKGWRCSLGTLNLPDRRVFFDIPTFRCHCCGEEFKGDFDFSLGKITGRGRSVVGKPLDQGSTKLCVPYSFSKQMEITKNVKALIKNRPLTDSYLMRPLHLNKSFEDSLGDEPNVGPLALLMMAQILLTKGICNMNGTTLYKASNISTINRRNTVEIVQSLADGFPLNAGFFEGRRLARSRYCRPYKPPSKEKMHAKCSASRPYIPAHAAVLIGARRKRGKLDYYYMNSWRDFCIRRDNRGRRLPYDGIGKIDANRLIRNVIRISRFKEEPTNRSFVIEQLPLNLDTSRNFDLLLS